MARKKGMRKLLIVESPAKIKTIKKILGSEFNIMSTFGHVKDLPENKIGVEITPQNHIKLEYDALPDKVDTIAKICEQAKKCDEIYLASDPDREGEIIAWHIGREIAKNLKTDAAIHRIVFNEITKEAIEKAITVKRRVDRNKVNAQQARRVLDRWVGYEVSPILWRKITKGLSAGRVQSVALRLVCEREEDIEKFTPEEYWSIHVLLIFENEVFEAELSKIKKKKTKIDDEKSANKILSDLKKESFKVIDVSEKKRFKNPIAPFITSTLQQDAYNRLGFSVNRTMKTAQKLYEGVPLDKPKHPEALITYMRTDSVRLSDTALRTARSFIKNKYGAEYLPPKPTQYTTKGGAQDAHEAIRPINVKRTPEEVLPYLKSDQAKLYNLIWKRFVASQMKPAEYFQRVVTINAGNYELRATGSTIVFDGFLKVYRVVEEENKKLVTIPKNITKDADLGLKKTEGKQHFTKPPARYSQATLVKELEKKDVGRPSTYATTLSTLERRQYVTVDNRRFMPTELGKTVTKLLVRPFSAFLLQHAWNNHLIRSLQES